MEIQLENQFIEKLKELQEDLFAYMPFVDYFQRLNKSKIRLVE